MRFLTTAIALLVIASFANAQDSAYAAAASKAFAERKPLIVFIGVKPRPITGAFTVQVQSLEGYGNKTIVVSKPGATWLEWIATMPADATDAEITNKAIEPSSGTPVEALDEVNAVRAARGLPPYTKDEGLTKAAMSGPISSRTANRWAHAKRFRASAGRIKRGGGRMRGLVSGIGMGLMLHL